MKANKKQQREVVWRRSDSVASSYTLGLLELEGDPQQESLLRIHGLG